MFAWSHDELIGQSVEQLIPEAARTSHVIVRENYQKDPLVRPMGAGNSNLTALRKDGTELQVEISLGPIETPAGKLTIAAIRNVTERKNAERGALRSQRLESLGSMASGIAHDLNNTFQPILMVLEMLRADYPEQVTEFLTIAEQSARRGSEMVLQLLTFAKGSKGSRILIEPRHLLKEIEKIVRNTFSKSIHLRVNYQEDPGTLLGDPTQLHQVLLNLCVNARDAMANGGTLTLAVDTLECDATFVKFFADAVPGPYIRIRISDTGCGIPPELIDRIFEPFFTTKPRKWVPASVSPPPSVSPALTVGSSTSPANRVPEAISNSTSPKSRARRNLRRQPRNSPSTAAVNYAWSSTTNRACATCSR